MRNKEILQPNPKEKKQVVPFKHSCNAGDLIYSLPTIRAFCEAANARAAVYAGLGTKGVYSDWHPQGDDLFTKKAFLATRPLIEAQDYIDTYEVWEGQSKIAFNLDLMRSNDNQLLLGMPFTEIRSWAPMILPELGSSVLRTGGYMGRPWLTLPFQPQKDRYLVVNLTHRYRNYEVSYDFLHKLDIPIYFIGVLEEYDLFLSQCPKAQYVKTEDYLQVANLIAGSRLFIGNQSSCFAVAEGMGHPRILEICRAAPNVFPATPFGTGYVDQTCLEHLVNQAIK